MKNKSLINSLLIGVVSLGVFAVDLFGANASHGKCDVKIATVSSIKMGNQYTKVADLQNTLEANINTTETELKKKADEYDRIRDEYMQLAKQLSDNNLQEGEKKALENKVQEKLDVLKQKEQALTAFHNEAEQKIIDMRDEGSREIALAVKAAAKEIAEQKEVTLLIDSDHPSVFYAKNCIDITDEVVKKLNDDAKVMLKTQQFNSQNKNMNNSNSTTREKLKSENKNIDANNINNPMRAAAHGA